MSSSRESPQPRDQTYTSYVSCIAGKFFTTSTIREALRLCVFYTLEGKCRQWKARGPGQTFVQILSGSSLKPYVSTQSWWAQLWS